MVKQKDLPKDLKKNLKKNITASRSKSKTYKIVKISAAALCAAAVVAMVIITGMRNADNVEKTLNTTVMGTTASLTVYGIRTETVSPALTPFREIFKDFPSVSPKLSSLNSAL